MNKKQQYSIRSHSASLFNPLIIYASLWFNNISPGDPCHNVLSALFPCFGTNLLDQFFILGFSTSMGCIIPGFVFISTAPHKQIGHLDIIWSQRKSMHSEWEMYGSLMAAIKHGKGRLCFTHTRLKRPFLAVHWNYRENLAIESIQLCFNLQTFQWNMLLFSCDIHIFTECNNRHVNSNLLWTSWSLFRKIRKNFFVVAFDQSILYDVH